MENQLSIPQDRIGATECKSKSLEVKNTELQMKVDYWNVLYSQEIKIGFALRQ